MPQCCIVTAAKYMRPLHISMHRCAEESGYTCTLSLSLSRRHNAVLLASLSTLSTTRRTAKKGTCITIKRVPLYLYFSGTLVLSSVPFVSGYFCTAKKPLIKCCGPHIPFGKWFVFRRFARTYNVSFTLLPCPFVVCWANDAQKPFFLRKLTRRPILSGPQGIRKVPPEEEQPRLWQRSRGGGFEGFLRQGWEQRQQADFEWR